MANCLEQKGTTRAMSRGDYDGLVANEPPAPEFSPRRVLKNYGDMTTSEFQSHLIKLDTTFRGDKALTSSCICRAGPSCSRFIKANGRFIQPKQPVNHFIARRPFNGGQWMFYEAKLVIHFIAGDHFILRKQLQDDQLQTESLLVSRHRQLLMTDFVINESTVNCWWYNPEVHQKHLIFHGDSGKGNTPLASCLAAMVARDVGLDEFVMVSSPDMLRSAVERSLLRDEILCSWTSFRSAAATSAPKAGEWTR